MAVAVLLTLRKVRRRMEGRQEARPRRVHVPRSLFLSYDFVVVVVVASISG